MNDFKNLVISFMEKETLVGEGFCYEENSTNIWEEHCVIRCRIDANRTKIMVQVQVRIANKYPFMDNFDLSIDDFVQSLYNRCGLLQDELNNIIDSHCCSLALESVMENVV